MSEHVRYTRNRREFLCEAFCGFGALAYTSMLQAEGLNPLAPKTPPEPAKAKSVIFLFMAGVALAGTYHRDIVYAFGGVGEEIGNFDAGLAVSLEGPLGAKQARIAIDELVFGFAERGRALLSA